MESGDYESRTPKLKNKWAYHEYLNEQRQFIIISWKQWRKLADASREDIPLPTNHSKGSYVSVYLCTQKRKHSLHFHDSCA